MGWGRSYPYDHYQSTSCEIYQPKPIRCSTIATFIAGAVIFGVLAGLAFWKGGGLSFKNATFSYLGFGAVAAASISLSSGVILAIFNRFLKSTALTI